MEKQCYIGMGIILLTGVATLGYKKYKAMFKKKKNEDEKKLIDENDVNHTIENTELKVEM